MDDAHTLTFSPLPPPPPLSSIPPPSPHPAATASILLPPPSSPFADQVAALVAGVERAAPSRGLGAVVCAAGGWAGGGAADPALPAAVAAMHAACVEPAFASAHAAASHLAEGGTVILTGSAAALGPSPGMLAYGAAKAATHHLARSLAAPGSGLPAGARVYALLPRVIDTPNNRKWMGGGDTSSWTPPGEIARAYVAWAEGKGKGEGEGCPPTGSLVLADTVAGETAFRVVGGE